MCVGIFLLGNVSWETNSLGSFNVKIVKKQSSKKSNALLVKKYLTILIIACNITNLNIGTRSKCVKIRTDVLFKIAGFAMTNLLNKMRLNLQKRF